MHIQSLKKLKSLAGKKVFLRVDFNVPFAHGKITEDYKLAAALPTIDYLVSRGARLVIATHWGDPNGKTLAAWSTKPLAVRLRKLSRRPVRFVAAVCGPKAEAAAAKLKPGEILMIENLRFERGEYENDDKFGQALARLGEIYVNDAFAVCHRKQASVGAIKKYLPCYAGLLLENEVKALAKITKPKKPLVIVMGGAKVRTKVPLLLKLHPQAAQILVGGALANSFYDHEGYEIGRSLTDRDSLPVIRKFLKGKKLDKKIILPVDVVVKNSSGRVRVALPQTLKKSDCILDIGPETIALFAGHIKKAQTLVWNGPLGKFEEKSFRHGTLAIAGLLAARSSGLAYGVVGGGETVEALNQTKMSGYVDWVSTAGGAMLSYLGGDKMPGLDKIIS